MAKVKGQDKKILAVKGQGVKIRSKYLDPGLRWFYRRHWSDHPLLWILENSSSSNSSVLASVNKADFISMKLL